MCFFQFSNFGRPNTSNTLPPPRPTPSPLHVRLCPDSFLVVGFFWEGEGTEDPVFVLGEWIFSISVLFEGWELGWEHTLFIFEISTHQPFL